jgi:two-component system chemotaxis response regulator CheB
MAISPEESKAYRVLIADDSTFMRRVLSAALTDYGFDVVGEAADGDEALALWSQLQPDVMTLDLAMPGLDGMGVLRALHSDPGEMIPIVVVSAFSPAHGARAVDALAEGAFDLVAKPAFGEPVDAFIGALHEKVTAAARAKSEHDSAVKATVTPIEPKPAPKSVEQARALLIVSSTGGPRALTELVPQLAAPAGMGGAIVQHMPAGFTASLASRLDRTSDLRVSEAVGGELLTPDSLLLAPGGSHLRLDPDGNGGARTRISDEPPVGGLRPRADLTIADAASIFGERLLLVVMTGMGRDALVGARAVRDVGGKVIAEAAATCTVYGMPRAIVEAGLADDELPLPELAQAIGAEVGG